MVGADPDQLRQLGMELERAADDLDRRRQRLQRLVVTVNWRGPVADRLRSQFQGIPLGPIVDLLRGAGSYADLDPYTFASAPPGASGRPTESSASTSRAWPSRDKVGLAPGAETLVVGKSTAPPFSAPW